MNYNIVKIATLIGAHRYGNAYMSISDILTDSRSLCFAEETLFFALRTHSGDGHLYIEDLYQRGVRAFVVEQLPAEVHADANYLKVSSSIAALQRLAERHRDEFSIPIIGITGSNGKTWVKEWLYQLLRHDYRVARSPRSYNSQVGVPLSVWLLSPESEIALFEAGISMPGEMASLADIIQPTIGILTSLGEAHQENFRSLEEKCMEKLLLFKNTSAIVYPSDNDTVSRCVRRLDYKGERIGWSQTNDKAPMYISCVEPDNGSEEKKGSPDATKVCYVYKGTAGSYSLPFSSEAAIVNSITCAATALHLGMTPETLAERMQMLDPIAMRLEVIEGERQLTLINDSYNSDLNSLAIALDFLNRREALPHRQASGKRQKKTLILSDILQSGEPTHILYNNVAQLTMQRGITKFIGIGHDLSTQQHLCFAKEEQHFFDSVAQLLDSHLLDDMHDETILLKGARRFGFEKIVEEVEQKVHETILEVDLEAMVHNLNYYRSFLKPETKIVCMIKANGYGTGAVEIAKTLQEHHADYLAVAVADEGVALRKAGITANIMVMNPEMSSFKTIFDYDLEPEIYSFRLLEAFIKAARKEGITGWPVHIKLDTGMHRLGFSTDLSTSGKEPCEIDRLIDLLHSQQAVMPRSVFSHFVGSDSEQFDDFSLLQWQRFTAASDRLRQAFSHTIIRHICNSAGITHFPERQMEMCRLGIGLYGVDPSDKGAPLKNVATLKTTILQMRQVSSHDTVGYSRKGTLKRDSVIAAIPIGYADGLNRHLGNSHCYCLVNGQKAPYVGNICMDVAMIDVTGIDCKEGDQVEIFGNELPISVLSNAIDTIPYEILTSVSDRVKRVYFKE